MASLYRGLAAAVLSYCLFVIPAFAGGYKPYPVQFVCADAESFDHITKSIREDGHGDAVRLINFYMSKGRCVFSPIPVDFLGEKIVRDYGDMSEWDYGTGNVVIEGILVGGDTETKVYVLVDDAFHGDMKINPEVKS